MFIRTQEPPAGFYSLSQQAKCFWLIGMTAAVLSLSRQAWRAYEQMSLLGDRSAPQFAAMDQKGFYLKKSFCTSFTNCMSLEVLDSANWHWPTAAKSPFSRCSLFSLTDKNALVSAQTNKEWTLSTGLASDQERRCSAHHPEARGRTSQVGGATSRLPKISHVNWGSLLLTNSWVWRGAWHLVDAQ